MHHGRVVKRTGDGSNIEYRSVDDAVRCAGADQPAITQKGRFTRLSDHFLVDVDNGLG